VETGDNVVVGIAYHLIEADQLARFDGERSLLAHLTL
jgi:hypothetical protein